MSLLKKMAQAAARKVFLNTIISKAPDDIKMSMEQICANAQTVDALQQYAMVDSKKEAQYPLSAALVEQFDIPNELKELIIQNPAIISYLNELLEQFQPTP